MGEWPLGPPSARPGEPVHITALAVIRQCALATCHFLSSPISRMGAWVLCPLCGTAGSGASVCACYPDPRRYLVNFLWEPLGSPKVLGEFLKEWSSFWVMVLMN